MIFASGGGLTFTGTMSQAGLLFAVLFTVSFFFSGTEIAFFSLQKVERQKLATAGKTGERVVKLLSRRDRLITTLLMGNETANVLIATVGASIVAQVAPGNSWLNIVLLTPAILLVSEITPKVLAVRYNRQWSLAAAWPLTVFYVLVTPIRWLVGGIVSVMAARFRVTHEGEDEALNEAEIRTLIAQGADSGGVDKREREIIEAVFEFDDLTVDRLMTPRPDIFAVPLTIQWSELLLQAREHGFSRVPVYEGRFDNIIGTLLIKDLLRYRKRPLTSPRQLRSMLLAPHFVPVSKPADDLMREFMKRKMHQAIVVDEHGTIVGLVSLDDLLSELVGDLLDIDEDPASAIEESTPGVLSIPGDMDVEDFIDETGVTLPDGEYHTVGGFIFHELGRLPKAGDTLTLEGHTLEVAHMDGRRVAHLRLRGKA